LKRVIQMKILINTVLIICAAGIGVGLGFALRKKTTARHAETSAAASALTESPKGLAPDSRPPAHILSRDESPLATKLERDLSMSTSVTHWLYWLEAMENAVASDFPRLLRLAENSPAAMRLVSERWIELYPRHLYDTLVDAIKNGRGLTGMTIDLSHTLFNEWLKRDPDAAIAALSGPDDFGMRRSWRSTVAARVIEKDAERGLRLMSEWHIENFGPRMTAVTKWAAADPCHAAEFTLANPAGHASEMTMETIGKEWAKSDPRSALEFAASQSGELGSILATATLKEWAGRNLNEAAAWLAAADSRTRNHLSPSFVEAWGKQDANGALAWCESNLTGSSLAQAVSGVVKGAAEKDLPAAAALVASLNPSSARAEAAVAIAGKMFPEWSQTASTKPETIAWLASLDPDSARRVLDKVVWQWSTSDPKSMAAFLSSSSERFPARSYDILAREMARKNPLEALEWAVRLPENRGLSAGAVAFGEWRRSQPDDATKWFNDLPATDSRREPYFKVAISLLVWDTQASQRLAALPVNERAAARGVIETMTLPEDRRAQLLSVLKAR
jgi:hypothetical protein